MKKKSSGIACLRVLRKALGLLVLASCSSAAPQERVDTTEYRLSVELPRFPYHVLPVNLVSVSGNKCLETLNRDPAVNADVIQNACDGTRKQDWWLVRDADAYYIWSGGTGRCLNVNGGGNGADVIQSGCSGNRFRLLSTNVAEQFAIQSVNTGKCVDIAWPGTEDAANAQQWTCLGTASSPVPNQTFRIQRRTYPLSLIKASSAKCVRAITNNASEHRACAPTSDMKWHFERATSVGSTEYFNLRTPGSNTCLRVTSTVHGAVATRATCNAGTSGQQWMFEYQGDDSFRIVNRLSGRCLSVTSDADGSGVVQHTCGQNQNWFLAAVVHKAMVMQGVAKDDGSELSTVSDADLAEYIAKSNETYRSIGLKLSYNPADRLPVRNNTTLWQLGRSEVSGPCTFTGILGNMTPTECAQRLGNSLKPKFMALSTGSGNMSSLDATNWILIDGIGTVACNPAISASTMFPHELGHFLAMGHTSDFYSKTHNADGTPDLVDDFEEANTAYLSSGLAAFDSDQFADTPPEPNWKALNDAACQAFAESTQVTFSDGTTIEVPTTNVMGYHTSVNRVFSPTQSAGLRATLFARDWAATHEWDESFAYAAASGAAVSSWGVGRLDLFWVEGTTLKHTWTENGARSGVVEDVATDARDEPAAVSWGVGRIDVFYRSTANAIRHKWYVGGATFEPAVETIGTGATSGPAVASWEPGRLDVFWSGGASELRHSWYAGSGFSAAQNLGGLLQSKPAVVSWGPQRLDIFWRGVGAKLFHKYHSSTTGFSATQSLASTVHGAPAVSTRGPGRLDVFWQGPSNALLHMSYPYAVATGSYAFSPEQQLGSNVIGAPAAVSWSPDRVDVFIRRTTTGTYGHLYFDANHWRP